jgi:hypothetical protein
MPLRRPVTVRRMLGPAGIPALMRRRMRGLSKATMRGAWDGRVAGISVIERLRDRWRCRVPDAVHVVYAAHVLDVTASVTSFAIVS